MDRIEQGDGVVRLVGLEPADQVEPKAGSLRLQRRPFVLRLLHAILAELALSRLDQRPDRLGAVGLRDGDQGHIARRARRPGGRRGRSRSPRLRAARAGDAPVMAAAIGSAMSRRQPLPRLWLMTDERQGEGLWAALERLPQGGRRGVSPLRPGAARAASAVRTGETGGAAAAACFSSSAAAICAPTACHGGRGRGLRSASAHNLRELRAAERSGAALVFLSPAFATRSHPGARPLGPVPLRADRGSGPNPGHSARRRGRAQGEAIAAYLRLGGDRRLAICPSAGGTCEAW